MRISSLTLHDFRNFAGTQTIEFPEAPLLIASAPNATGKTNFLEALVVLLRGKSFRGSHADCVRWGNDFFLLRGTVEDEDKEKTQLAVQYQISSRTLRIEEEGEPVSPVIFYSHYPLVMFLPDDAFLFYRGPALRRNFLNSILLSSPQYLSAIVQYQRALKQRNAVLKSNQSKEDVDAWTQIVATHAEVIWDYRQMAVDYLKGKIGKIHSQLFAEDRVFELKFIPGAPNTNDYVSVLNEAWPYEQKYKYTLYGPHRDDLQVEIDGKPATAVLSRGQMRSLIITLKVAAQGFIESLSNRKPILLFDEVLSELDDERQSSLLTHLSGSQILLTCTAIPAGLQRMKGMHQLDIQELTREVVNESKDNNKTSRVEGVAKQEEIHSDKGDTVLQEKVTNNEERISEQHRVP